MAKRRMFSKIIIDSDDFLDMPASTQLLYFHLSMRADDDGFINKPKSIIRCCGGNNDDLKLLIAKNYIIAFDSGVIAIKDWKVHNFIPKDRYTETIFKEEKATLTLDENNSYTPCIQNVYKVDTKCIQNAPEMYTECTQNVYTGKVREGKVSQGKDRVVVVKDNVCDDDAEEETFDKIVDNSVDNSTLSYVGGKLGKGVVLLSDEQTDILIDKLGLDGFNHYVEKLANFIIEKKASVKNHYSTILKWYQEDLKT